MGIKLFLGQSRLSDHLPEEIFIVFLLFLPPKVVHSDNSALALDLTFPLSVASAHTLAFEFEVFQNRLNLASIKGRILATH